MPIGSPCLAARPADRLEQPSTARPVAASTVLRPALDRPSTGRVLAVFPTAVYVQLGDDPAGDGSTDVVALVSCDGLRLPLAAVLAEGSATAPFAGHRAGDRVEVDAAGLRLGAVCYSPGRWWSPRAVAVGQPTAEAVHELRATACLAAPAHDPAVERALVAATEDLRAGLLHGDPVLTTAAADAVLGLGPGLTPSGDDLIAGVLVTCHWLAGGGLAAALGRHVAARAAGRTTALSAALLRCAAAGAAAPPVLDLVDALTGRRPVAGAVRTLLAVGSTSGHDTARGVLLAAEVLLDRRDTPTEEDS